MDCFSLTGNLGDDSHEWYGHNFLLFLFVAVFNISEKTVDYACKIVSCFLVDILYMFATK